MTTEEKKTETPKPKRKWGDGLKWGEGLSFGPFAPPVDEPKTTEAIPCPSLLPAR